jgi:hypothetical protein
MQVYVNSKHLLIYTRLFVVLKPLHTCHAKEENVLQIRGQTCMYGLLFGVQTKQNVPVCSTKSFYAQSRQAHLRRMHPMIFFM